jgi:hypothetical protein
MKLAKRRQKYETDQPLFSEKYNISFPSNNEIAFRIKKCSTRKLNEIPLMRARGSVTLLM